MRRLIIAGLGLLIAGCMDSGDRSTGPDARLIRVCAGDDDMMLMADKEGHFLVQPYGGTGPHIIPVSHAVTVDEVCPAPYIY